ncbi:MAG: PTS sugar transporter subunit IIB [Culicoidibacterales bacterium]
MKTIKLFCAAGMSTSMLVNKMIEAATKQGIAVEISAHSEAEIAKHVETCDVALLGPQVGYRLKAAEVICAPHQVPVAVIPMIDYGMMNGEKVLAFALNLK